MALSNSNHAETCCPRRAIALRSLDLCISNNYRGFRQVLTTTTAVAAFIALYNTALAGPSGGTVVGGSATIQQSGTTTNINQSTNNAIINWQSFSIGKSETVNFNQPSAVSATLNRVTGNEKSVIAGALNANGQVFLVNSNGVVFTKGAQVNVGGLVASTLDITNENFMAGKYTFSGSSNASVINKGHIRAADGGFVVLMGKTVSNDGVISAKLGTVAMASGEQITLNFGGNSLLDVSVDKGTLNALVQNKRAIIADGGQVILTAKAANDVLSAQINNTGVIEARSIGSLTGGSSGTVHVGKIKILADGGNVNLSGKLDVSARGSANAGSISVLAKGGTATVSGTLKATAVKGNGGTIETSGDKVVVADTAVITTKSISGQSGNWIIDPDGFTIGASGGDISGATLSAQLANGNVSILSTQGSGTDGSIYVDDALTWSANQLTLTATNSIYVNTPMNVNGTGTLALNYGSGLNADGYTSKGIFMAQGTDANGVENGTFTGSINFANTGNLLTINGASYTVENSLNSLTTDVVNNPSGNYALGTNLAGGSYTETSTTGAGLPIATLLGNLNGLGHTIDGLSITSAVNGPTGFIGTLGSTTNSTASVTNLGLTNVSITKSVSTTTTNQTMATGALVGSSYGTISSDFMTGTLVSTGTGMKYAGGLVGYNSSTGVIQSSYAALTGISAAGTPTLTSAGLNIGGLVGYNGGAVIYSNAITTNGATFNVTMPSATNIGGLIGTNGGWIIDSYSNVALNIAPSNGGGGTDIGGLAGTNGGYIIDGSYSLGSVTYTGNGATALGGLVGLNTGTIFGTVFGVEGTSVATVYASGAVNVTASLDSSNIGGLVGRNNGTIEYASASGNVTVINTSPVGTGVTDSYVGGLVGYNAGPILNVAESGNVLAQSAVYVSGLVGYNGGSIKNATVTAQSVVGAGYVGGLAGFNGLATIANSSSSANVAANPASNAVDALNAPPYAAGDYVGGAVGLNNGVLNEVSVTGSVAGYDYVGGLVGSNQIISSGTARNSGRVIYGSFTGTVTGHDNVGGAIGDNGNLIYGTTTNANVSGADNAGLYVGTNSSATYSTIVNPSASGSIGWTGAGTGTNVGGLIGYNVGGTSGVVTITSDFVISAGNGAWTTNGIGASTLLSDLGSGDLTISAAGNIDVNAALNWSSSSSTPSTYALTLTSGGNININATLTWSSNVLTLNASSGSIYVNTPMNVNGTGALALNYGSGLSADGYTSKGIFMAQGTDTNGVENGTFTGSINFANTGNLLTINGATYTVENSLSGLTSDIANNVNSSNDYALGTNLTASTGYTNSAIASFSGNINGLGHTIDGLTITSATNVATGFVGTLAAGGSITNLGLTNVSVTKSYSTTTTSQTMATGSLVGVNNGTISDDFMTGTLSSTGTGMKYAGGLVGYNSSTGTIQFSYAALAGISVAGAPTSTSAGLNIGGLVGYNGGYLIFSNAITTGAGEFYVTTTNPSNIGGLTGTNGGWIVGSYSDVALDIAPANGGAGYIGGLAGTNGGYIIDGSYASGSVTYTGTGIPTTGALGGLVGYNTGTIFGTNYGAEGNPIATVYASGAVNVTGSSQSNYIGGLVGRNDPTGTIEYASASGNVTVINTSPVGTGVTDNYVGGLVGYNTGSILNVAESGNVTAQSAVYVGGIAGQNSGTIKNATVTAQYIVGAGDIGGLAGFNTGTISNGSSSANVSANPASNAVDALNAPPYAAGDYVGGAVGSNSGTISNANITGSVSGNDYVGGLVGSNQISGTALNSGKVIGGSSSGAVTGHDYVGGVAGQNSNYINGATSSSNVSGNDYVGGIVGNNTSGSNVINSSGSGSVAGTGTNSGGAIGGGTGNTTSVSYHDAPAEAAAAQAAAAQAAANAAAQVAANAAAQAAANAAAQAAAAQAAAAQAAANAAAQAAAAQAAAARAQAQAQSAAASAGTASASSGVRQAGTPPNPSSFSKAGTQAIAALAPASLEEQVTSPPPPPTPAAPITPHERKIRHASNTAKRHTGGGGRGGAHLRSIEINGERLNLQNPPDSGNH